MEKNYTISLPKVIFEDQQILVCDKPANLAVTNTQTIKSPTLQDWLGKYFRLGTNLGIGQRAGIVHRLDRQTSGVIIVAKTQKSFEGLQQQFLMRQVLKNYLTLVHGIFEVSNFKVDAPISRVKFGKFGVKFGGRQAVTTFAVLKKFEFGEKFRPILKNFPKKQQRYFEKHAKFYSLLQAQPSTGRSHQIRVHLKSVKKPVVSDPLYLSSKLQKFDKNFCPRLFLHSAKISFTHPTTGKLVKFEAKLPNDLTDALQYLKEASVKAWRESKNGD